MITGKGFFGDQNQDEMRQAFGGKKGLTPKAFQWLKYKRWAKWIAQALYGIMAIVGLQLCLQSYAGINDELVLFIVSVAIILTYHRYVR